MKLVSKQSLLLLLKVALMFNCLAQSNVGIGTSMPARAKVELHGNIGGTTALFGGDGAGVSLMADPALGFNLYSSNTGLKYMANGFAAMQVWDQFSGFLYFRISQSGTANTTIPWYSSPLTIHPQGMTGISSSVDESTPVTLTIAKNPLFESAAVFSGSQYNSYFNFSSTEDTYIRGGKDFSNVYIYDVVQSNQSNRVLIGSQLRVGINTYTPTYTLDIRQVGGTGIALVEPSGDFSNWEWRVGYLGAGPSSALYLLFKGTLKSYFSPANGSLNQVSDERLKTNVMPLNASLEKIMKLRPVLYQMKDNNNDQTNTVGFVAQEVQKLFPQLVDSSINKKDSSVLLTMQYGNVGVIAVKGIQEEQILLSELQKKQKLQNDRIAAIEKKMASILSARQQPQSGK